MHPVPSDATIMQALAAAGGPTPAAGDDVTIGSTSKGNSGGSACRLLAPARSGGCALAGDVVVVSRLPEADQPGRYAVLGEVPTPGMFDMPVKAETRVLDAVARAGLLRPTLRRIPLSPSRAWFDCSPGPPIRSTGD